MNALRELMSPDMTCVAGWIYSGYIQGTFKLDGVFALTERGHFRIPILDLSHGSEPLSGPLVR